MLHKHPYGPATKFSATSTGGEYKINDVYHTRYNQQFGEKNFEPRVGQHKGTGYHNLRPQIFYRKSLDHLDNPFMGSVKFKKSKYYKNVTNANSFYADIHSKKQISKK